MPGQLIHFDRKNAQSWTRRARAAGALESHDLEVARRIRLLQARATGNLQPLEEDRRPLIRLAYQRRPYRMRFSDVVIAFAMLCGFFWWVIFG